VRGWLYVMLLVLIALVVVGGATRLTDSGLSITEWKPIHGVIPPIGEAQWQEEFAKYRQIPEYEQVNKGMSLDAFKGIFWWEWGHRLLARGVGVVFAAAARLLLGDRAGSTGASSGRSPAFWRLAACRASSAGGWSRRG
jgi:heme A synthase